MDGRKWLVSLALIGWEIKKQCAMPMLPIFLLLCIVCNSALILGNRYGADHVEYVKEARALTGRRLGADFEEKARALPESEQKEAFLQETVGASDIFEGYDAKETARLFISKYGIGGWAAGALERKYEKQQVQIRRLAEQDASMDLGIAGMTKPMMDILFQKLCRAILIEGILAAVFIALYLSGKEQLDGTCLTVYVSRRGRRIHRDKLIAGAVCALAAYLAVAFSSCMVFADVWQLGDVWETNMSTQFNYISAMGLSLPFVSWTPFTIRGYLAATMALGTVVVLVFYGLAYVGGLAARNSYAGFLLLFVMAALNFQLIIVAGDQGQWAVYELALWSPVALWWWQPLWFTDMGISALVPWQECWVAGVCMAGTMTLLLIGFWRFYHKDLTYTHER